MFYYWFRWQDEALQESRPGRITPINKVTCDLLNEKIGVLDL